LLLKIYSLKVKSPPAVIGSLGDCILVHEVVLLRILADNGTSDILNKG
jgi:hypothetical protein